MSKDARVLLSGGTDRPSSVKPHEQKQAQSGSLQDVQNEKLNVLHDIYTNKPRKSTTIISTTQTNSQKIMPKIKSKELRPTPTTQITVAKSHALLPALAQTGTSDVQTIHRDSDDLARSSKFNRSSQLSSSRTRIFQEQIKK